MGLTSEVFLIGSGVEGSACVDRICCVLPSLCQGCNLLPIEAHTVAGPEKGPIPRLLRATMVEMCPQALFHI